MRFFVCSFVGLFLHFVICECAAFPPFLEQAISRRNILWPQRTEHVLQKASTLYAGYVKQVSNAALHSNDLKKIAERSVIHFDAVRICLSVLDAESVEMIHAFLNFSRVAVFFNLQLKYGTTVQEFVRELMRFVSTVSVEEYEPYKAEHLFQLRASASEFSLEYLFYALKGGPLRPLRKEMKDLGVTLADISMLTSDCGTGLMKRTLQVMSTVEGKQRVNERTLPSRPCKELEQRDRHLSKNWSLKTLSSVCIANEITQSPQLNQLINIQKPHRIEEQSPIKYYTSTTPSLQVYIMNRGLMAAQLSKVPKGWSFYSHYLDAHASVLVCLLSARLDRFYVKQLNRSSSKLDDTSLIGKSFTAVCEEASRWVSMKNDGEINVTVDESEFRLLLRPAQLDGFGIRGRLFTSQLWNVYHNHYKAFTHKVLRNAYYGFPKGDSLTSTILWMYI